MRQPYLSLLPLFSALSSRRFLRLMTRQPYRLRKYWSTVLRPIGLERTLWEEIFFQGSFTGPGLPWPLHSAPHSVPWRSDCLWAWYRGISGDWRINPYSALWRSSNATGRPVSSLLLVAAAGAAAAADGTPAAGTPFQIFSRGVAGFFEMFGVPVSIATVFMTMCVSALALTSLDAVARIGRMSFQELFSVDDMEHAEGWRKLLQEEPGQE